MRKLKFAGKLSLYLGSISLFFAGLFALILYLNDDSGSGFYGIQSSYLWPFVAILTALGLFGIMAMFSWGSVKIEEDVVLHIHNRDDKHLEISQLHASEESQHHKEDSHSKNHSPESPQNAEKPPFMDEVEGDWE